MGFSFYLVTFFVKYFKGDVFINYAFIGLADALAFLYIGYITKFSTIPGVMRILLVGAMVSAVMYFIAVAEFAPLIPVALMFMRLHVGGLFNYSYHTNSKLFPVLVKGAVFAVTNSVARPFQALATIVAEYIENPAYLIFSICFFSLFITLMITDRDDVAPVKDATDIYSSFNNSHLSMKGGDLKS